MPLGVRLVPDRELVPDGAEQAAIARARDLPGDGRSLREIVSTLTAEGHGTKRGGQWYPPAIASLLDTERA